MMSVIMMCAFDNDNCLFENKMNHLHFLSLVSISISLQYRQMGGFVCTETITEAQAWHTTNTHVHVPLATYCCSLPKY